jgi:F-type H+-transporting ATPase subunit gamma
MQMIAAAKFAQSQHRATATKPFTDGVFELVRELAATAGDLDHPLISGPARTKDAPPPEVTLIITSDRGLCGPYNGQVLRTLSAHRHDSEKARAGKSELIGKKGVNYLKFNRIPVDASHHFGDKPSFEEVERLAQRYMDQFLAGEIAGVNVIYMSFISAGRQAPRLLQLLPLKPPASDGEKASGPVAESCHSSEVNVVRFSSPSRACNLETK